MIASPPPPRAVAVDRDLAREAEPSGLGFGALLRRYRTEAGLSQEALAERAKLSVRAIRALENGERQVPYPATIGALVMALGLTGRERAALEVVEHQEQLRLLQVGLERGQQRLAPVLLHVQRPRDGGKYQLRRSQGREIHEPDAVRESIL